MTVTALPNEPDVVALTRDDIKALRNAASIVFRFNLDNDRYGPIGSFVEANIEHDPGDGFGKRELRKSIPINPAHVTNYSDRGEAKGACEVFTSARYVPQLATLFTLLKPGDELHPRWTAGNDTDVVRERGVTIDEFAVRVRRPGKAGKASFEFLLHCQVTTPHSQSRNIRW